MAACSVSVSKSLLFVFNAIFALCGLGLLIAGSVIEAQHGGYGEVIGSDIRGPPIILIVIGCFVFLIASLGCFGAIRESRLLLILFSGSLIIIFILQLAAGITALVASDDIRKGLKDALYSIKDRYSTDSTAQEFWDTIQSEFHCCGVSTAAEWLPQAPPSSCFGDGILYIDGCFHAMQEEIQDGIIAIGGVAIGFIIVELVGIALACCLISAFKEPSELPRFSTKS